jgi:hypothetical protein
MYGNFGPGVLTFKPSAGACRTNRSRGSKPGSDFWAEAMVEGFGPGARSHEGISRAFRQAGLHEDLPVLILQDEIGSCWVVGEVEIDG